MVALPEPIHTPSPFARALAHYREREGLSQNALGHLADVNPSYVHRLEAGERSTPTRQIVTALAQALDLTLPERDHLFAAAGYLASPHRLDMLHDPTIEAVLGVLCDKRLPAEEREEFRAVIESIAERWRRCP